LVARKQIHPVVDKGFPLAEAAEAHRRLEQRAQFGKIVLKTEPCHPEPSRVFATVRDLLFAVWFCCHSEPAVVRPGEEPAVAFVAQSFALRSSAAFVFDW